MQVALFFHDLRVLSETGEVHDGAGRDHRLLMIHRSEELELEPDQASGEIHLCRLRL